MMQIVSHSVGILARQLGALGVTNTEMSHQRCGFMTKIYRRKIWSSLGLAVIFWLSIINAKASTSVYQSSTDTAKEIRKVLPELSFDERHFIVLLKQNKLLTVPKSVAMMHDFTNFPAPPDAGLRREISEIITEDGFAEMYPAIFYFPAAKIGFVNIQTQGNGACSVWRAFSIDAEGAHLAPRPQSMENVICADDGGNVYVGSIGNQPVVIETIDAQPISAGIAVIYVSSWTGTDWDGIATVTERQ